MYRIMSQTLRARGQVVPGVDIDMLSCRTDVAQAPLQRRGLEHGTGAAEAVTGRNDLATHFVDPGGGLMPSGGSVQVIDATLEAVLPLDITLLLHERAGRTRTGLRPTELKLHCRSILQRNAPVHRPLAGFSQINEVLDGAFRQSHGKRGMNADKKKW